VLVFGIIAAALMMMSIATALERVQPPACE